jgi:hypothetical protein
MDLKIFSIKLVITFSIHGARLNKTDESKKKSACHGKLGASGNISLLPCPGKFLGTGRKIPLFTFICH